MRTVVVLAVLLLVAGAISLLVGPVSLHAVDRTVAELRLTRLAAGILAGSALAVAGVLMQGLFRNPLASPSVCGVSEGAALAMQVALLVVALAPTVLECLPADLVRPLAGMLGAAGALTCLLATARRRADLVSVLLVGMVLSLMLSAVAATLLAVANDRWELGRALVALSLGGVEGATPGGVRLVAPLVLIGIAFSWSWGLALDVALSGDAEAAALGVDLPQVRRWVLIWAAVLTAGAVSLGGGVAFVGLVVPNLLRMRLGPPHRPLILTAAIGGAAFVTSADILARVCHPGPGEIPLGVITSLVGAPCFLWFIRRESQAGRL